ncbi:MAG: indolepyruvate oxidoreductase subunit beta [Lachnospiraceae bacterium]|nr:indolepyruvate oxidoreductase subunit beta [Lachnospiraceae bacterium]
MQTEKDLSQVNIVLCGVGGQGTVLASRLIADAAMKKGIRVCSAETIGMAQRGGSVFTNLRIGDDVKTPRIGSGKADLMIAFEPAEAVRMLPYLKEGGAAVVSVDPIMPVSAMVGTSTYPTEEIIEYLKAHVKHLTLVDSAKAAAELKSAKCLNVVLLGAAVRSGCLNLSEKDIEEAINKRLPEKLRDLNIKALMYTAKEGVTDHENQ